jgi:hypothetical protein
MVIATCRSREEPEAESCQHAGGAQREDYRDLAVGRDHQERTEYRADQDRDDPQARVQAREVRQPVADEARDVEDDEVERDEHDREPQQGPGETQRELADDPERRRRRRSLSVTFEPNRRVTRTDPPTTSATPMMMRTTPNCHGV